MAPSYLSLAVVLSGVCAKSLETSRTFFSSIKNIVVYKLLRGLYKPELKYAQIHAWMDILMQIIPFCDYGESCFSNNRISYGPQIVVKYVSTGLVNQKLDVMPQIEEKHEEREWQFLEVLWNTN